MKLEDNIAEISHGISISDFSQINLDIHFNQRENELACVRMRNLTPIRYALYIF